MVLWCCSVEVLSALLLKLVQLKWNEVAKSPRKFLRDERYEAPSPVCCDRQRSRGVGLKRSQFDIELLLPRWKKSSLTERTWTRWLVGVVLETG